VRKSVILMVTLFFVKIKWYDEKEYAAAREEQDKAFRG
jgi:hypothetical protein